MLCSTCWSTKYILLHYCNNSSQIYLLTVQTNIVIIYIFLNCKFRSDFGHYFWNDQILLKIFFRIPVPTKSFLMYQLPTLILILKIRSWHMNWKKKKNGNIFSWIERLVSWNFLNRWTEKQGKFMRWVYNRKISWLILFNNCSHKEIILLKSDKMLVNRNLIIIFISQIIYLTLLFFFRLIAVISVYGCLQKWSSSVLITVYQHPLLSSEHLSAFILVVSRYSRTSIFNLFNYHSIN